jgi:site-specific recombinase XerD
MPPYTSDPRSFPAPVDLSHHLSRSTKAREASSVKKFYKYFSIPGIAQLAGGRLLQRATALPMPVC